MIERTYGSVSRSLGVLAEVYMSGVDAWVGLLKILVCCTLKENRSKHELDASLPFLLILIRFASRGSI